MTQPVSGPATTMTVVAMGLGYSITAGDPTILSANISEVRAGLDMSPSMASFVASLATLTLAAAVLGAGAGVAFAFLLGLSLALINAVFPEERRASAIAMYLGAGFALTTPMPAVGSLLAEHFGWRSGFLVAPVASLIALAIVLRYVPETPRASRRLDVPGLLLVAVALLALVYGISQLQTGLHADAIVSLAVGVVAAVGFVLRETHTPEPALDLRIFGSGRFDAAVVAGATFNFLTGGTTILFAFYLITVRHASPALLGLLLIPATVLQAFAATGSGRAAQRFGDRAVLVAGLLLLLAGLLSLTVVDETTSMAAFFVVVALIAVGGAGGADPTVDDHDVERAPRPVRFGVGGQVGRRPDGLFARSRAVRARRHRSVHPRRHGQAGRLRHHRRPGPRGVARRARHIRRVDRRGERD